MGLNNTPSSDRVHIGFFGRRNAGKSSIVNAVTNQSLSVVSDVAGTTTDPVYKAMELLPMGPVMIIDTPGIDDEGELGELRVKKTRQVLNKTDVAVLVVDAVLGMSDADRELKALFEEKKINYIIVYNKTDIVKADDNASDDEIYVSAKMGDNIEELKNKIAKLSVKEETDRKIVSDLLKPGDLVVLVIPIDASAPKGRLILPQQQTIRDILDAGCGVMAVRDSELEEYLSSLCQKPAMVICDSQVFGKVNKIVPKDIPLTSFSILFARFKGNLKAAVSGAKALDTLMDGDTVLISEGCTHHRQCEDIGTVKLPGWITNYTNKNINFEFTSGGEFPEDLSGYKLIIHCGGCMLNAREMAYRKKCAMDANVPFTNYGITIAYINGILKRSIGIFPELS